MSDISLSFLYFIFSGDEIRDLKHKNSTNTLFILTKYYEKRLTNTHNMPN